MGLSEAFIVIYSPVWVNNFAPPEHSAKWMGILHSCTALGVLVGYVFAGIIINFCVGICTWRFALQIQGFALIPVGILILLEDKSNINIDMDVEENCINNMTHKHTLNTERNKEMNSNDLYSFNKREMTINNPNSANISRKMEAFMRFPVKLRAGLNSKNIIF